MDYGMDRAWLDEAVELTRALWQAYLLEPTEEGGQFILDSLLQDDFSLIGTGKHEMYPDLASFSAGFVHDQRGAQGISFEVLDDYCEARSLDENCCIVFGTLWVREKPSEPKSLLVEMDTRYSVVYRRVGHRWLLVHLHHSTPNVDQYRNEYYPKTVTEKANAALAYSKILEQRAELDLMTGLLNHAAFESHVAEALAQDRPGDAFFMIDLDNFKQVNDTLGHPEGDLVIIEFAVFAEGPLTCSEVQAKANELTERWTARSDGRAVELGCSVGLALVLRGQSFRDVYRSADRALYDSKRKGKGRFGW